MKQCVDDLEGGIVQYFHHIRTFLFLLEKKKIKVVTYMTQSISGRYNCVLSMLIRNGGYQN